MIEAMPGVFESVIFGVPHPDFGNAVIAAVVRRQSPDGAVATETGMLMH
jgi:malonyl-CoA/methylmalonyl-CoA synthetase